MAMLERYLEIINTVLQTRHHKYKTLMKKPQRTEDVDYCNVYHKTTYEVLVLPEGTKYSC